MSLFVTVEGIEGSGKSTLVRSLSAALRRAGHDVLVTHEPGDTPLGQSIREILLEATADPPTPMTELLLYLADRNQHVERVIRPALAEQTLVLCDRFSDSTIAYQGHGRGLDLEMVGMLDRHARDALDPDLTLVLDCDPANGLARARGRSGTSDRLEGEPLDFHARVRAGFQELAAADPSRYIVLDGSAAADQVAAAALRAIETRLAAA